MVWLLGTLAGMGKGVANATKKSVEFAVDIGEEVLGVDDEYDGVWGTIWGSWNDNVMGAQDGDGVVQHLFGEEGTGGRFFGMIPEGIRSPATSVITPTFEALDFVYENLIDRNLGTLITVGQQSVQSSFDVLTGKGDIGDVFTLFNPDEWRQAYMISESRSAGQSLVMAASWIDLDDAAEVERFKGTGLYKFTSGVADAFFNIVFDPANVLLGAGKVGKLSRMAQNNVKKKVGLTPKNTIAALQTEKYRRFDAAIEKLRYADDLTWSDNYKKGTGLSETDIDNIDLLTARILKEAETGNLGLNAKAFTADHARALASLPNKAAREQYLLLAVTGGDMSIMSEMRDAARAHNLSHQEGGLRYQLHEINKQIDASELPEGVAGPTMQSNRDFLLHEQKRLEKQLMEENPTLPFGAALSMKEERLRALAVRKDIDRGPVTADELNARHDALNDDPHLVNAAADQVLLDNHVDTMEALPSIGAFNSAGLATKTFIDKTPILGSISSTRLVRAIVEKVPQGMIIWDDAQQSFNAYQRMLRDAERIGLDGVDAKYIDSQLGKWTSITDTNAQMKLFDSTVNTINGKLVQKFADRMEGVNKNELTFILQRQYKAGDSALKAKAKNARLYGQKGIRITDAAEGGEIVARYMPVTTAQLESAALVPRYDLYKQAFNDQSIFRKNVQQVQSVTAGAINGFTSVWKKSVLLRPAWPMRVLIDEYARVSAQLGTMETLKSMMGGMGDLRANWFRKNGEDLGPLIQQSMIDELNELDDARMVGLYADAKNEVLYEMREVQKTYSDLNKTVFLMRGKASPRDVDALKLAETRLSELKAQKKKLDDLGKKGLVEGRQELLDYYGEREVFSTYMDPKAGYKISSGDSLRIKPSEYKFADEKNYYDLVEQYVGVNGHEATQSLVQNVIYDAYGKSKVRRRTLAASAAAGVVAGPVGLAIGGLYGYMARNSLKRLAKMETGTAVGLQLRSVAKTQLRDEITGIRKSVENVTDPDELAAAAKEIEDLQRAADMIEAQAKELTAQQQLQVDSLTERNQELYDNFDRSAKLLHDAGLGNAHIGGIGYSNHFGNTAQEISVYRAAISADNSNRALWDSASNAQRKQNTLRAPKQYDLAQEPEKFVQAYNDTVNRQFVPSTDPSVTNAYQEFQRLMWNDEAHINIVNWLKSREGAVLQDAMPHYFKVTDDFDYNDLLEGFRREVNSLVPNHPDFIEVRKQIAEGREVNWNRDIQPILDRKYEAPSKGEQIEKVRRAVKDPDFGKVIGDSKFQDAAESGQLLIRINDKLESIFQNIGTMPTDVLTRSLVFKTTYTKEVQRRIARFEKDGLFKLKESDIKGIEKQARQVALKDTRDLLYDLAERSRFEEVVSNLMPFYGAWQEVITRWTGLAVKNPAFVMSASRNMRTAINTMEAEDENGNPKFVLRLPEGMMTWEIPVLGVKAFGKISALGENAIDFNFGSASMISAGLPGFGPMVSIPASETVLKVPELAESLELILPFGPTEGQSFLERVIKNVQPTWTKAAASSQFSTAQRQRVKARITADLAAHYYENGEVIDTETEWLEFEKEVDRRATAMLTVRMLGNLALPLSFTAQSPHYKVINGHKQMVEKYGLEEADEWLLDKHPDMFAILGRQTKVRTVASATLEGEKLYQETKEFADEHQEIGQWIVGSVGSLDSGFEYNRAVQIKEINEGRRVRLEPREIYTRAAEARGWNAYRDQMGVVNQELARRGANGLSVNLNANSNSDLKVMKRKIVEQIAIANPQWKMELDEFKSDDERSKVVHAFREAANSPLFEDRIEIDLIREYIGMRDLIATELERRLVSTNNSDLGLLSNDKNDDLQQLWLTFRLKIGNKSDFAPIMDRYFDEDTSINKVSWPTSYLAKPTKELIGEQA